MVSAQVRRQQVEYAQERGLSSRRACALLSVARSTLGYESRLAAKDAPVVAAMRALSAQYRGSAIGVSMCSWSARARHEPDRATVCGARTACRCRAAGHGDGSQRVGRDAGAGADQPCLDVRLCVRRLRQRAQLKCLTVVDEYSRDCLAIDVAGSIRSVE